MSSAETTTAPKEPEVDTKMEVGEKEESKEPSSPAQPETAASAETPATAASTTSTTPTPAPTPTAAADKSKGPPSAVEFEPPVACVRRILKKTLPSSSNVGKDAVAAFARASGIFIIYLTACANDFARENRRQTITANDVLAAIKELEFDEFAPELTTFLERYRELEKNKKNAKAKAAAERAKEAAEEKDDASEKPKEDEETSKPDDDASMDEGGTTNAETPEKAADNGDEEGETKAMEE